MPRQARQVALAQREGQGPQIFAAAHKDIEGVKLHLVIMPTRMQGVEVGDAVDAEHHGLSVDDEVPLAVLQRGLDDPRVALGPIRTVAREEAHPLVLPNDQHSVAVVLYLVDPVSP